MTFGSYIHISIPTESWITEKFRQNQPSGGWWLLADISNLKWNCFSLEKKTQEISQITFTFSLWFCYHQRISCEMSLRMSLPFRWHRSWAFLRWERCNSERRKCRRRRRWGKRRSSGSNPFYFFSLAPLSLFLPKLTNPFG